MNWSIILGVVILLIIILGFAARALLEAMLLRTYIKSMRRHYEDEVFTDDETHDR